MSQASLAIPLRRRSSSRRSSSVVHFIVARLVVGDRVIVRALLGVQKSLLGLV
jgi:hypothetical protein